MIITKEQKKIIESLIPEYKEALIAYGGDMYRQGLIRGALCTEIAMVVTFVSSTIIELLKKSKK